MRFQLAVLSLALLLLPSAHAEDPVVTVETLGGELVQVVGHVDPAVVGRVMTLCGEGEVAPGENLVGYIKSECFEMLTVEEGVRLVGPDCELAVVRVVPATPAANISPNASCAASTAPWAIWFVTETARTVSEHIPVIINIE